MGSFSPLYVSLPKPPGDGVRCWNTGATLESGRAGGSGEEGEGYGKRWGRNTNSLGQSWPWCEICLQEPLGEEGRGVSVSPSSPASNPRADRPLCLHSPGLHLPLRWPFCMWLFLGSKAVGEPVTLAVAAVGTGGRAVPLPGRLSLGCRRSCLSLLLSAELGRG